MTYKLNPNISKVISPVRLILPDGDIREFKNGMAVGEAVFEHHYQIVSLYAVDGVIEVKVEIVNMPLTTWVGEEQSFF